MSENEDDFNASRAELFEALGHPTRIKILQALRERPMGFSELKKEAGLDSNALLAFHLGTTMYSCTYKRRTMVRSIPS